MNNKVYMHGIGNYGKFEYHPMNQILLLEDILKCGELLSRRLQGFETNGGFSGSDYISLADYEKKDLIYEKPSVFLSYIKNYNAYHGYIKNSIAFAFPKEKVDAIELEIIDRCTKNSSGWQLMRELGESETTRYSDLPDEVQVKDRLSLDKMCYITFPTDEYISYLGYKKASKKLKLLKEEIEMIKKIQDRYGYNVPIYDICSEKELNEENMESLVLKR